MGNPGGGDGENKCRFPTACEGRERGSARGVPGVLPASSVEGLGPSRSVPRLRPWSPEIQAAGWVGKLVS